MRPTPQIRIGGRPVGGGAPCFIIAEVGINHNGDYDLACASIRAAAAAGADAVKFQNYRTEDFVSGKSLTHSYVSQGREVVESQWDMFKRCEIEPHRLAGLAEVCRASGVAFMSTPTGNEGVDELVRLGAGGIKNGSDYLTNIPLIQHMARARLPVIISTGMATLAEVDETVRAFEAAGGTELAILHCVSSYPAATADLHLRKIVALREVFQVPVGFSDHSEGIVAAVAATALGASIVEKHVTLDKSLPGPDHAFSADPAEFTEYVRAIRAAEMALRDAPVGPTARESLARRDWRLSCTAVRPLQKEHVIRREDLRFMRPGTGVRPADADFLIGRSLSRAVEAGHVFSPEDFR